MDANCNRSLDKHDWNSAETTGFLRRFAQLMSSGANAEKLLRAADVVERLVRQHSEAERRAEQAESSCKALRDLCSTAKSAIQGSQFAIAALEKRIELLSAANDTLLANADDEKQRLNDLLAESESEREQLNGELACRNAELRALRDRPNRPLASIQAIRNQFSALADQCESGGNIVAITMCHIGGSLAEQAISEIRGRSI